uniref:Uncharacterized protein n=1 Tax=Araneus ventricosus TaxID=182803 RepID=A0A4Y2NB51_ARAVE|nr:hypothetical protein AVEN_236579-1 [Araneus ventricosus]
MQSLRRVGAVIRFLRAEGTNQSEIHCKFQSFYGPNVLNRKKSKFGAKTLEKDERILRMIRIKNEADQRLHARMTTAQKLSVGLKKSCNIHRIVQIYPPPIFIYSDL